MSKKNLILLSTALIAGGHFAGWTYATNELTEIVEHHLEDNKQHLNNLDIDLSYKIKPYGYPFKVGVTVDHYEMSLTDKVNNIRVNLVFSGENAIYMKPKQLLKALTMGTKYYSSYSQNSQGDIHITKYTENGNENAHIRVNIARSEGQGELGNKITFDGNAEDIDVYITDQSKDNHRLLTANHVRLISNQTRLSDTLVSQQLKTTINDITFFSSDGEKTPHLDFIAVDTNHTNVPNNNKLTSAVQAAQENANDQLDLSKIKKELVSYVQTMSENATKFSIDRIQLRSENTDIKIKSQLSITRDLEIDASLQLEAEGLKDLQDKINATNKTLDEHPIAHSLAQTNEKVSFNVKTTDGMLLLNGLLLTNVPNILDVINKIPDAIAISPTTK